MGRSLRGTAAIVGVADAASPTGELDTRGRVLEAAMIREALADADLTLDDVDGICCSGIATGIAEYLGVHPRFVDGTFVGGSSFELHVEHAAAAIAAGLCDVVCRHVEDEWDDTMARAAAAALVVAKGRVELGDALVNLRPETIARIVNDEL